MRQAAYRVEDRLAVARSPGYSLAAEVVAEVAVVVAVVVAVLGLVAVRLAVIRNWSFSIYSF